LRTAGARGAIVPPTSTRGVQVGFEANYGMKVCNALEISSTMG
jgi:hypothetical protein